jgi:hypothetical protein
MSAEGVEGKRRWERLSCRGLPGDGVTVLNASTPPEASIGKVVPDSPFKLDGFLGEGAEWRFIGYNVDLVWFSLLPVVFGTGSIAVGLIGFSV